MLQTLKRNNEKWKKSSPNEEKSLVGLTPVFVLAFFCSKSFSNPENDDDDATLKDYLCYYPIVVVTVKTFYNILEKFFYILILNQD
jgi:hypothetical protein